MHQLTENVKVLQKIVLINQGKCLILRRADSSMSRPGKWDLPGGNVEWPKASSFIEQPHQAEAAREVAEETGIQVAESDIVSACYVGTYFDGEHQVFSVILGWKVVTATSTVKLSPEHTQFSWISLDKFDEYDFGFAGETDGFIRKMIENAFGSDPD